MKKVRVTGSKFWLLLWDFWILFCNFSKFISSLKAQVCNILKNHIDIQIFLLDTDFLNYSINKWFLHKFDIFMFQNQNKNMTNCAEFTLQWRNYPIWRYVVCNINFLEKLNWLCTIYVYRVVMVDKRVSGHVLHVCLQPKAN